MSESADRTWLATMWPFVSAHLPPQPAQVLEVGCGPLGGFVPMLRSGGYHATGVDPDAPAGPDYRQVTLEQHTVTGRVDAVIASQSLHHVTDLVLVFRTIADLLAAGGVLVVLEWARERFDETTARWCFERLPRTGEPGWLHRHRDAWQSSGQTWDSYLAAWAADHRLHTGADVLRAAQTRFRTRELAYGPYNFAELDGVAAVDEQAAAIDAGHIQATGLRYVAVPTGR